MRIHELDLAAPFVVRYRTTNGNLGVMFVLRQLGADGPDFRLGHSGVA